MQTSNNITATMSRTYIFEPYKKAGKCELGLRGRESQEKHIHGKYTWWN